MDKNVILDMALNLSDKDIASLCSTNKRFKQILCDSDIFWRKRLMQKYGVQEIINPKQVYIDIVENNRYCPKYSSDSTDTFILDVPLKIKYSKYIPIFNFITDKIFAAATDLPRYFEITYDRYIKDTEYGPRVEKSREFTNEDYDVLIEIMKFFERELRQRGNRESLFMASVLKGIIEDRIPFEVKIKNLCNYNIY